MTDVKCNLYYVDVFYAHFAVYFHYICHPIDDFSFVIEHFFHIPFEERI